MYAAMIDVAVKPVKPAETVARPNNSVTSQLTFTSLLCRLEVGE